MTSGGYAAHKNCQHSACFSVDVLASLFYAVAGRAAYRTLCSSASSCLSVAAVLMRAVL
jgi:hypothetical protein